MLISLKTQYEHKIFPIKLLNKIFIKNSLRGGTGKIWFLVNFSKKLM
jgi:hypothetical protein